MTITIFEITNCDDESAELFLRSALEQIAFLSSSLVVHDIFVEPHDITRGIIAEIVTDGGLTPEHVNAVKALIHVQCPENKSIKIKYLINTTN